MPVINKQRNTPGKRTSSVVDRIKPVSQRAQTVAKSITVNIYGRSGSGKTTLACSFPKPLLLIGAEDGTESVYNVKGVDFVRINSSAEVADLVTHQKTTGKYRSVVIDTASSLQDLILKEILGLDELPAQLSWGLASQQQWGQVALQTKERLRSLLDLSTSENPCNVVICAQERDFNTEGNAAELLAPFVASALSPSVVGWLNPACNYIGQTFIRQKSVEKKVKLGAKEKIVKQLSQEVEYCFRSYPDPVYTTKFRVPKGSPLPPLIVDPDYSKIIRIIQGGQHAGPD